MQLVYGGSFAHANRQKVDVKGYTYIDKNGNRVVVSGFSRYQNRGSQDEARSKASLASAKYEFQMDKRNAAALNDPRNRFKGRQKNITGQGKDVDVGNRLFYPGSDKRVGMSPVLGRKTTLGESRVSGQQTTLGKSGVSGKALGETIMPRYNIEHPYQPLLDIMEKPGNTLADKNGKAFRSAYDYYKSQGYSREDAINAAAKTRDAFVRQKAPFMGPGGSGIRSAVSVIADKGRNDAEKRAYRAEVKSRKDSARAAEREEANEKYNKHPEDWAEARGAEYAEAHERYYTPETVKKMNQAAQEAARTQAKARWNNEATRLFGKDVGNALYKSSVAVGDTARAVAKKANELYSTATETVSNIVKNIKEGPVGNFFSRVFNKGKDILSSIFGGIKTAANKVGEVASYVGQKVSTAASRLATMTKNTTQYQDFVNWSTTNVNRPIRDLYNRTTKSVDRNVTTPIKNFISNGIGFISALFAD